VRDVLDSLHAVNVSQLDVGRGEERYDFLIAYLKNDAVGDLLAHLEPLPELEVVIFPNEVIPFVPPISEAIQDVRDVAPRSPVEIYLGGLQSIGRWPSFLTYAAIGAGVVWIGFFTNTVYLVLASMLIAPFAEPAMNFAIASAAGDLILLGRSFVRYMAALIATALVAGGLTLLLQPLTMTPIMQGVSEVSAAASLLPLMAGAVAALTLVQSEGSSLISGATTGVAVAASLAPPAGLVGMSLAMGRWDILDNVLFVLALQLIGINLTGALVFRIYGVTPGQVRLRQGKRRTFYLSLAVSVVALIALLVWQFSGPLRLQRSSEETRSAQVVEEAVASTGFAKLVDVETRFRGRDSNDGRELLVITYLRPTEDAELTVEEIMTFAGNRIERALLDMDGQLVPLVEVNVVEEPARVPPD
jgi:uncharacterized membrane protein